MAKSEVLEKVPCPVAKGIMELKKELQRMVQAILDADDCSVEVVEEATKVLNELKELKLKKPPLSLEVVNDSMAIPEEFKCPISRKLMNDPVILSTGQTYDRKFIQRWLSEGNRTCPQTHQVLSYTNLTPNHLVREMISQWCKEHGIVLPTPAQDDGIAITEAERESFNSLLQKMSSSLSDKKAAAKKLRLLTKMKPSIRAIFAESVDAISLLLSPLSPGRLNPDTDLQEDVITTLFNLSIHSNNKQPVAKYPSVIPLLIDALKYGTIETRKNAAATLSTLSDLDSAKNLIGKSGALRPLIFLLDEGHPLAIRDAATATFNLCLAVENRRRAVCEGAVSAILRKIMDGVLVAELLAILAMLSGHQKAIDEMRELGAVPWLLRFIRESTDERSKENCAAILYNLCLNDETTWEAMREEETDHYTISNLADRGTARARRKAEGLWRPGGRKGWFRGPTELKWF